jgi:molecular chaperone HtpG
VMEHCEKLVPQWLRFLRGVVDSEDLSLNVSREMLQESRALGQIETQLVKQVLRSLRELADGDRAKYEKVFELFGKVLKEGIATEVRHRDALAELCLFETVQTPAGVGPFPKRISLAEYVSAARDDQPIYYLTGTTRHSMEASPHLEAFKKRGLDVLLLSDPIDEWVVQSLPAFQKRPLKSVSHGELDLGDAGDAPEAPAAAADAAVAAVKRALAGKVRDVRLSKRLTDSASCLVAEEGALGSNMERMLRMLDESTPQASRVLELNGAHPIVKNLGALAEREPESPALVEWSETLYEQAPARRGHRRRSREALEAPRVAAHQGERARLTRGASAHLTRVKVWWSPPQSEVTTPCLVLPLKPLVAGPSEKPIAPPSGRAPAWRAAAHNDESDE